MLLLAGLLAANTITMVYSSSGFISKSVPTTLSASLNGPGSVCQGANAALSGGNSISASPNTGPIQKQYYCWVKNTTSGQFLYAADGTLCDSNHKVTVNFPTAYSAVTCTGAVETNFGSPAGYPVGAGPLTFGSSFAGFAVTPVSPSSMYNNTARTDTGSNAFRCQFTVTPTVTSIDLTTIDSCCALVAYYMSKGGASTPATGYMATAPATATFITLVNQLTETSQKTVSITPNSALVPFTPSLQSFSPATRIVPANTAATYTISFTNPNSFPVDVTFSATQAGTTFVPASISSLGGGATTTVTGSVNVGACNANPKDLGTVTVTMKKPVVNPPTCWPGVTSLAGAPVTIGSVTSQCANLPPTVAIACAPLALTIPAAGGNVQTICTATATDPESDALTYTWTAGGSISIITSNGGKTATITYNTAGTKQVTASAKDPTNPAVVSPAASIAIGQANSCTLNAPTAAPFVVGKLVSISFTYLPTALAADPARVNWGDGVTTATCSAGTCTSSYTYLTPGPRTIFATIASDTIACPLDQGILLLGPVCTGSASPATLTASGSSTITISYSNYLVAPAAASIVSCGSNGVMQTAPTCVNSLSGGLNSGTCIGVCKYTAPAGEGTYPSTVQTTAGGIACANTVVTTIIGPKCSDFVG